MALAEAGADVSAVASASNNLGNMLQATGRVDEALTAYEKTLQVRFED